MGVYLGQSVYNDSQVTKEFVEQEIEKNGPGIFWVTYNVTNLQQIQDALTSKKLPVIKYIDLQSGNIVFAPININGQAGYFTFSSGHTSTGNYIVFRLSQTNTWSMENKSSKDIELISFTTTFAQVGEILTSGKLPILVDETIEDSPYYYNFIYDNDGLEYVFGNLSGTTYREYRVSGGGWGVLSSITFEKSSNRVTTWSSTPSNTKYPSEKLVYDTIGDVETLLEAL